MAIYAEIINRDTLTKREAEVFKLICEGHPDKAIAMRLAISIKTVEAHIDRIYSKIGVQHQQLNVRVASIATAVARGLVKLSIDTLCLILMVSALNHDDSNLIARIRTQRPAMARTRRFA